jgi:hypothetical protein
MNLIELTAGMQTRKYEFESTKSLFGMKIYGNSPSIVFYAHNVIFLENDETVAVAGHRFINKLSTTLIHR